MVIVHIIKIESTTKSVVKRRLTMLKLKHKVKILLIVYWEQINTLRQKDLEMVLKLKI